MKNIKIYGSFHIISESLTPSEISKNLGIVFDKQWIKGDKIIPPKGEWFGKYYNHTAMFIDSKLSTDSSIEEHTDYLLSLLDGIGKKIKKLSGVGCVFGYSIYAKKAPGIHFTDEQIKKINDIGADIDIEFYQ